MARRHKQSRAERRARKTTQAIETLTARVTCSTELTGALALLCEHRHDKALLDTGHPMFALELWKARPSEIARCIVELATELATELDRHRQAVAKLRDRFLDLNHGDMQEHLDPADQIAVRRRLTEVVEMQAALSPGGPFALGTGPSIG